jgi:hypothetical protein
MDWGDDQVEGASGRGQKAKKISLRRGKACKGQEKVAELTVRVHEARYDPRILSQLNITLIRNSAVLDEFQHLQRRRRIRRLQVRDEAALIDDWRRRRRSVSGNDEQEGVGRGRTDEGVLTNAERAVNVGGHHSAVKDKSAFLGSDHCRKSRRSEVEEEEREERRAGVTPVDLLISRQRKRLYSCIEYEWGRNGTAKKREKVSLFFLLLPPSTSLRFGSPTRLPPRFIELTTDLCARESQQWKEGARKGGRERTNSTKIGTS